MPRDLPAGTVTFLFTDVEGSTKLLDELGAEDYAQALAEHRRIVRESCAAQGGAEVDTQGDGRRTFREDYRARLNATQGVRRHQGMRSSRKVGARSSRFATWLSN